MFSPAGDLAMTASLLFRDISHIFWPLFIIAIILGVGWAALESWHNKEEARMEQEEAERQQAEEDRKHQEILDALKSAGQTETSDEEPKTETAEQQ